MSHTVTMRTATINTSTSAVLINIGFFKTFRGMLQLVELALGIAAVAIMAVLTSPNSNFRPETADLFFMLMVTTFMVTTGCLVISGLFSISSDLMISKTLFGVVYHVIGFALLLAASLNFLVVTENYRSGRGQHGYNSNLAASIIGLTNSVLYLFSSILGIRSYRMI